MPVRERDGERQRRDGGREREYFRISVITNSSQSMFNVEFMHIFMNVHCLIAVTGICFAVLLFGFGIEKNYTPLHAIFL